MKKTIILFFVLLLGVSCSEQPPNLSEFPLEEGTTWVYLYETYEPSSASPAEIVKATYQITEIVTETKIISPYFLAHIESNYELLEADNGWRGFFVEQQPRDIWYVYYNRQIFRAYYDFDKQNIDTNKMSLDYIFPLSGNQRWCQFQKMPCSSVGWRVVIGQSNFETPVGKLDDCYDMRDIYNGGGRFHTFCTGVGIVFQKHDHMGTPYGYEKTLFDYSIGAP